MLINVVGVHTIHFNLNAIFDAHGEQSYYMQFT